MFAAESSVAIAEALIAGTPYDLDADIQKMREIRERVRLGPSTGSIVEEAVARDIPGSDSVPTRSCNSAMA
jgi:cyanophycin synthetase